MLCTKMVFAGYLLLIAPIILPKSFSCLVAQSEISRGEFKFLQLFLQLLLSRQLFFAAVTNAANDSCVDCAACGSAELRPCAACNVQ